VVNQRVGPVAIHKREEENPEKKSGRKGLRNDKRGGATPQGHGPNGARRKEHKDRNWITTNQVLK